MNCEKMGTFCGHSLYCKYCWANKDILHLITTCEYERENNRDKIMSFVGSVRLNSNFSSFLTILNEERAKLLKFLHSIIKLQD